MVNSGYLQRVNTAESFNTPTVLKSQEIPFIGSQEVWRQSCVLTRHLWALPLTFLFPDLGNTPLLLPFFPHRNPYSPHPTGNRVTIPISQLQKVKMCSAPHLLTLSTSFPASHPEHQLLGATHGGSPSSSSWDLRSEHLWDLRWWGDLKCRVQRGKRNQVAQKNFSFVFWNLVRKKKSILSFNWKQKAFYLKHFQIDWRKNIFYN